MIPHLTYRPRDDNRSARATVVLIVGNFGCRYWSRSHRSISDFERPCAAGDRRRDGFCG
jgi:hypothetical protein